MVSWLSPKLTFDFVFIALSVVTDSIKCFRNFLMALSDLEWLMDISLDKILRNILHSALRRLAKDKVSDTADPDSRGIPIFSDVISSEPSMFSKKIEIISNLPNEMIDIIFLTPTLKFPSTPGLFFLQDTIRINVEAATKMWIMTPPSRIEFVSKSMIANQSHNVITDMVTSGRPIVKVLTDLVPDFIPRSSNIRPKESPQRSNSISLISSMSMHRFTLDIPIIRIKILDMLISAFDMVSIALAISINNNLIEIFAHVICYEYGAGSRI